jgi:outer membrane protein W
MYGTSEKINQKFSSFGGTVYSRYFFGEGTKSFRPFVGINLGASSGYEERINFYNNGITSTTSISKYDISSFGANFNAGFAYSLSPKVTMVGSLGVLGFENRTFKNKENSTKETSNSFGFDINSLGNRFNIGVYLTL